MKNTIRYTISAGNTETGSFYYNTGDLSMALDITADLEDRKIPYKMYSNAGGVVKLEFEG